MRQKISRNKDIAEEIIRSLSKSGFKIQRYDAYSTDSIYLKLDYGVALSIRISDHRGKQHLKYRYNIGPGIRKKQKKEGRYFYPADQVPALIGQIKADKKEKIEKYGSAYYESLMQKNQTENKNKKGFWKEAKLIN